MNNFCAKVLLFGEYSVVKGGKGLALPFFEYSGKLSLDSLPAQKDFMGFLNFLANSKSLAETLDLERLEKDIEAGLRFDSDIPQGAGVGSSGALCAAVYSTYQRNPEELDKRDISEVMDHMALMESFYHGSSSGLDPLISFAQKPVVVSNRNKVEFVKFTPGKDIEMYLLDTKSSRKTSPFVHRFLKMCDEPAYMEKTKEFIDISDRLILSCLGDVSEDFDDLFYKLSKWQYLNLKPMITPEVDALWLEGLESKKFFLKLCGAGGGGHYIVYRKDKTAQIPSGSRKINF